MAERLISWILSLIGITIFVAIVGAIIVGVLAATGGASNECTPDHPNDAGVIVKRVITRSSDLSDAWQTAWNDLERSLDASQSHAPITFNESQVSSRADTFLRDKDAPVENVTVCFHDGEAEANAKVDVPGLGDIPILGGLFNTNARIRGKIDLSGDHPRITITKLEAGNLPGFASDQIKGSIEDVVNTRLDDLTVKHKYDLTFREGEVDISGSP